MDATTRFTLGVPSDRGTCSCFSALGKKSVAYVSSNVTEVVPTEIGPCEGAQLQGSDNGMGHVAKAAESIDGAVETAESPAEISGVELTEDSSEARDAKQSARRRIDTRLLDAVRTVLMVIIALGHLSGTTEGEKVDFGGGWAVVGFFSISIMTMVFAYTQDPRFTTDSTLQRRFWVRRLARLAPLYWLALSCNSVVFWTSYYECAPVGVVWIVLGETLCWLGSSALVGYKGSNMTIWMVSSLAWLYLIFPCACRFATVAQQRIRVGLVLLLAHTLSVVLPLLVMAIAGVLPLLGSNGDLTTLILAYNLVRSQPIFYFPFMVACITHAQDVMDGSRELVKPRARFLYLVGALVVLSLTWLMEPPWGRIYGELLSKTLWPGVVASLVAIAEDSVIADNRVVQELAKLSKYGLSVYVLQRPLYTFNNWMLNEGPYCRKWPIGVGCGFGQQDCLAIRWRWWPAVILQLLFLSKLVYRSIEQPSYRYLIAAADGMMLREGKSKISTKAAEC